MLGCFVHYLLVGGVFEFGGDVVGFGGCGVDDEGCGGVNVVVVGVIRVVDWLSCIVLGVLVRVVSVVMYCVHVCV